ncbi:aquaporin-11 isoform X1 [Hemicordylus capensis]|uniref:aquaporin-11 isoform X1 n=1 Tax=Hemicordylus capensis TaxID=884348 RepID=UPI0023047BDC|nr:aquaporin-11 isoform X1 [Hemicordylus capensis]
MAVGEACISLLVMAGTIVATAYCRRLAQQFAPCQSHSHIQCFFLELTGAFQICACTHELLLLVELPPQPYMALSLTYIFTVLHGLTLPDSVNNPSSSFQQLSMGRIMVKTWWLQTLAQFTGAVLANVYTKFIWNLGVTLVHSSALAETCRSPIQTTIANAFILELLFSFLFHLTLLQFESMNYKTKVHIAALLITTLVYEGGHVTGAIFNPALAFSLHMSCFLDAFWNYMLVYWVAPCLGSALVVVLWDEVLPLLRRQHLLG